jgi:hypothetical protein
MKSKMTKPNFFIIGAAKSGTTSLGKYLNKHPDIYMCPKKEPRHFALKNGKKKVPILGPNGKKWKVDAVHEVEEYENMFDGSSKYAVRGDNSPIYMDTSTIAARKIYRYAPDAKLLAILRDPVERSYSQYKMLLRSEKAKVSSLPKKSGSVDWSVVEEWLSDPHFVKSSMYYQRLNPFMNYFDIKNIKIVTSKSLKQDTKNLMKKIFDFLEVNEDCKINIEKEHNKGGIPRSEKIHEIIKNENILKSTAKKTIPKSIYNKIKNLIYKSNKKKAPKLPKRVKNRLTKKYKHDIKKLEKTFEKDLKHWLK